jgi:hypothetical protein
MALSKAIDTLHKGELSMLRISFSLERKFAKTKHRSRYTAAEWQMILNPAFQSLHPFNLPQLQAPYTRAQQPRQVCWE